MPEQVESLLDSCDRGTAVDRRDHAILLLLARLGMRAGEVAALTLDDFDWNAGVVTVPGKGQRRDPLPIPCEVGQAVAEYLQAGRPQSPSRHVFIRMRAPRQKSRSYHAVGSVARRALARAGLEVACGGSHMLRHSLATGMLRNGATLEDIGQIRRHDHPDLSPPLFGEIRPSFAFLEFLIIDKSFVSSAPWKVGAAQQVQILPG